MLTHSQLAHTLLSAYGDDNMIKQVDWVIFLLLAFASKAGYKCIRVFSIWDSPVAALVQEGLDVEFSATVQHNDQLGDENASTNAVCLNISVMDVG